MKHFHLVKTKSIVTVLLSVALGLTPAATLPAIAEDNDARSEPTSATEVTQASEVADPEKEALESTTLVPEKETVDYRDAPERYEHQMKAANYKVAPSGSLNEFKCTNDDRYLDSAPGENGKRKACIEDVVDDYDNNANLFLRVGGSDVGSATAWNLSQKKPWASEKTRHRNVHGSVKSVLFELTGSAERFQKQGKNGLASVVIADDMLLFDKNKSGLVEKPSGVTNNTVQRSFAENKDFEIHVSSDQKNLLVQFYEGSYPRVEDYEFMKFEQLFDANAFNKAGVLGKNLAGRRSWLGKSYLISHMTFEETRDIGFCAGRFRHTAKQSRYINGKYEAGKKRKNIKNSPFPLSDEERKYSDLWSKIDPNSLVRTSEPRQAPLDPPKETTVYVVKSDPEEQGRRSSKLFTQTSVGGDFNQVGQGSTGWILNALAFNPADNWLYAISQPRLGNNTAELNRYGKQLKSGDLAWNGEERVFDITPADDPCWPAGHLLQIHPQTGEMHDLGRVTRGDGRTDANFYSNYGFMGHPRGSHPNDLWGGINQGVFTADGKYLVSNSSVSGTGTIYEVDLGATNAKRTPTAKPLTQLHTDRRHVFYDRNNLKNGQANAEDYTPLYGEEGLIGSSPYVWGLVNSWRIDNKKVFLERLNTSSGRIDMFDVTNLKTKFGQSIPTGHQWGKAWAYGNNVLGFGTASSGASSDLVQLKIGDPSGADLGALNIELIARDGIAPRSYNSNGTSYVRPSKDVDLSIEKRRRAPSDGLVRWDLIVTNNSEDSSTGFTVYDFVPKGFKILKVGSNGQIADFQGERIALQDWSIFKSSLGGHDRLEALHGRLPGQSTVVISLYGKQDETDVPVQCIENIAGVIGLDKDPNAKSFTKDKLKDTVSATEKISEEDFQDLYGDLFELTQGKFGDLTTDKYCSPSLTIVKQIVNDHGTIIDEAAGGWEFTAKYREVLQSKSTENTGADKGRVTWRFDGNEDSFSIDVRESQKEGFTLHQQNNNNAICRTEVNGEVIADNTLSVTNVESNGFRVKFGFSDKKNPKNIYCTVQNKNKPNYLKSES